MVGVDRPFRHARYEVPIEAVEHCWVVEWSVEEPHTSRVVSHPSIHVVVEDGVGWVQGPPRRRFERVLEGTGRVFAVKLRPGAASALVGRASDFADRRVPLAEVRPSLAAWVEQIAADPSDAARVAATEALLPGSLDPLSAEARLAVRIAAVAASDPSLGRAEALAERFGMGLRTLQRLFRQHVGLTPKAVLRRYRLHEVLARADQRPDWASVAHALGYFDQAHLIRDVRAELGVTPTHLGRPQGPRGTPSTGKVGGAPQHRT
jgi:AraC-like DNA-binding protein